MRGALRACLLVLTAGACALPAKMNPAGADRAVAAPHPQVRDAVGVQLLKRLQGWTDVIQSPDDTLSQWFTCASKRPLSASIELLKSN